VNGRGQQGEGGQQQEQTGRTDAREQRKEQGKGRWGEWNHEGGRRGGRAALLPCMESERLGAAVRAVGRAQKDRVAASNASDGGRWHDRGGRGSLRKSHARQRPNDEEESNPLSLS
jgi:hypothetical protein